MVKLADTESKQNLLEELNSEELDSIDIETGSAAPGLIAAQTTAALNPNSTHNTRHKPQVDGLENGEFLSQAKTIKHQEKTVESIISFLDIILSNIAIVLATLDIAPQAYHIKLNNTAVQLLNSSMPFVLMNLLESSNTLIYARKKQNLLKKYDQSFKTFDKNLDLIALP